MPSAVTVPSSLEIMLNSLNRRDEKPRDVPPALPARPASRGRPPSSQRPLPLNVKIGSHASERPLEPPEKQDAEEELVSKEVNGIGFESSIFRSKRVSVVDQQPEESPYATMPELKSYKERSADAKGSGSPTNLSSATSPSDDKLGWVDTIDYPLEKGPNKEHPQVQASALTELQIRVLKAEATLSKKEEENVTLQRRLKQHEARWSEYVAEMKSKEEMWQKQTASLQMSLAASKKFLVDSSPVLCAYDSESAISADSRTPQNTPSRHACASDAGPARDSDLIPNAVVHLVKEFEQRSQAFEDDALFLTEAKTGQSGGPSVYTVEELRKLKARFRAWKKDYKVRLREAKAAIPKLGYSEGERTHRKWWGKRFMKM